MSLVIEPTRDRGCLIISFGGQDQRWGQIRRFEFLRFLSHHFPHLHRHFHLDSFSSCYHKGIDGHSASVDETVEYLRRLIRGYRSVYCIGVSSGGYAAILFGSLLQATGVLAFIPPTRLYRPDTDPKYRDLDPLIHPGTRYLLVGNTSEKQPFHHLSHCIHLEHHPNVTVFRESSIHLPAMRDDGRLLAYLNRLLLDETGVTA